MPDASDPLVSVEVPQPEGRAVGTLPLGMTLETFPAVYTETTVNVVLKPAGVEYETTPAKFEWVEGNIKGFTIEYIDTNLSRTISQSYLYQAASAELIMEIAPEAEDGSDAKPTLVIERVIPAVSKRYAMVTKASGASVERAVPYEYKDGKTRVPISRPTTIEKPYPAVLKQVPAKKLFQSASYVIRDESGQFLHQFETVAEVEAFLQSFETP